MLDRETITVGSETHTKTH